MMDASYGKILIVAPLFLLGLAFAVAMVGRWVFGRRRAARFAPAYTPPVKTCASPRGWGGVLGTLLLGGVALGLGGFLVAQSHLEHRSVTQLTYFHRPFDVHEVDLAVPAVPSPPHTMPIVSPEPEIKAWPQPEPTADAAPVEGAPKPDWGDVKVPLTVEVSTFEPGTATSIETVEELPEWVASPPAPTRAGDVLSIVLASQRFGSQEECTSQLLGMLQEELRKQSTERFPVLAQQKWWNLNPEQLQQFGVIRQACVATYPLRVDKFDVEVKQVHWNVELSPETTQRVYAAWRPTFIHDRLLQLGAALGLATSGLGIASLLLRRSKSNPA